MLRLKIESCFEGFFTDLFHNNVIYMKNSLMKSLLTLLAVVLVMPIIAQSNFKIKGHIEGLRDTTIYLANYYGKQIYYNDTATVDSNGNFSFDGKPYNECGKYILFVDVQKRLEIVVDQEDIELECTPDFRIDAIKVKKSKNNKIFFDYAMFITDKMRARQPIDSALQDSTKSEEEKNVYREELKKMNNDVIQYQKNLISKNPDLLVSKLIKMSMEIELPEPPADSTDDGKQMWQRYYVRNHYLDNIDLKDPRMIRDPAYIKVIERYVTLLPQIPDTMIVDLNRLVSELGDNKDGFKLIIHQFTYHFETAKIMCMDKGFVYMIDNYYAKGLCDWVKEDKIKDMKESADGKRNCLCGQTGLNIILPDTNDVWQSMHALNSKYTLLVIWEATCGHCKKELPKINELYKRWKSKGLEVFAVHNNMEVDKWKKFIRDEQLEFINVSRNQVIMTQDSATKLIYGGKTTLQSLNFHQYWDVNSTPKVYLMDKEKKIIAKSLGAEQLEDFLTRLESGGDSSTPLNETDYEDEDDAPVKVRPNGGAKLKNVGTKPNKK
jgi:thiol-disulfide isomerase/thioredoxin